MRASYTVFRSDTGEITRFGLCLSDDLEGQAGQGESVIEGIYPDNLFFIDGPDGTPAPTPRAVISALVNKETFVADGAAEVTISAIPLDAAVRIIDPLGDALEVESHDGAIDYSTDMAGTHRFEISGLPYLTRRIEVIAT